MKISKKLIIIISLIVVITIVAGVIIYSLVTKDSIAIFKKAVAIKEATTLALKLSEVSNEVYSMKIPEGWKMETTGEYETFGFRLYDPNNTARQIFYYGKFSPFLKSNEEKQFWINYIANGGYSTSKYLADAYVLNPVNIETFYSTFDNFVAYAKDYGIVHNFPVLGKYNLVERLSYSTPMANVAKDEAILRISLEQNNIPCEALLAGSVVDAMSYYAGGIDAGYYTVYMVSGIIAPSDEFILLEKTLTESLGSFSFTKDYIDAGVAQNKWETEKALEIGKMLSEANDSYNNAWYERQKSYDALSQKRSDSNLGYDRLYDKVTGDTYKAELGFYDEYKTNKEEYSNPNLELVPDSDYELYGRPISGYISK